MNVVALSAPPRIDLAEYLEDLARRVRDGAVTDLVLFYDGKDTGQYHYEATCTYERAVALTAMAHSEALRKILPGRV